MKIEYHKFEDLKEITLKNGFNYFIFNENHIVNCEYGFDSNLEYLKIVFDLGNTSNIENFMGILETTKITLNSVIQYNSEIEYINKDYLKNLTIVRYKIKLCEQ